MSYIRFRKVTVPKRFVTKAWAVEPVDGSGRIGEVRWFGRWRRYAFFPARSTVFEQDCLREIAQFVEDRTKEHRDSRGSLTSIYALPPPARPNR